MRTWTSKVRVFWAEGHHFANFGGPSAGGPLATQTKSLGQGARITCHRPLGSLIGTVPGPVNGVIYNTYCKGLEVITWF